MMASLDQNQAYLAAVQPSASEVSQMAVRAAVAYEHDLEAAAHRVSVVQLFGLYSLNTFRVALLEVADAVVARPEVQ